MRQTRPWAVIIDWRTRKALQRDAKRFGVHYGVFFSTSGKALIEQINPNAQYSYVWTTKTDK